SVESLAKDILSRRPIDVGAYRVLGLAAEARGDTAQATQLMQAAGEMSWQDSVTSYWLVQHGVQTGDVAAAVNHADALLRRGSSQAEELYQLLAALAGQGAEAETILA